jgi:hypothetical protein
MEIQTISESCQKILCNPKLYKDLNFFNVPHNKICLAVIKTLSNKSFAEIGKFYKKSWYSIYASVKIAQNNNLRSFTNKITDLVKEDLK